MSFLRDVFLWGEIVLLVYIIPVLVIGASQFYRAACCTFSLRYCGSVHI